MKKITVAVLFALTFFTTEIFAQTVVVTDNSAYVTGQASSVLDVYSVSKGFLAPRMTAAQRVAILAPAEGLLVYQIDGLKGFYYYTNSAWTSLSSSSGSAWSLTGNSGTGYPTNFLGTTDLQSLRFQTNSLQGMLLDSLGSVGIGLNPGFTPGTFREKLLVDAGTTGSYNAIVGRGSINNYLQLNIQNLSNGTSASSDVVATADNGNETVNYVDLGINSSTNTQNVMGAADDAYLYTTGNNFLIGTGTAAKALVFMTGGTTQSANERMRIDGSGNVGIGTASPAYKLHVVATTNPLYLGGVQTGLSTDSILTIIGGVVRKLSPAALTVSSSNAWALIGNSGTNPATNFLGTIDAQPLIIKASNAQVGRFDPNSLALGLGSTINNATNSYAFGSGANVGFNHVSAMALGNNAAINNDSSFAVGTAAVVNGQNSFAIGAGATANGQSGFAIGRNSAVGYSHTAGMAIGNGAAVNSDSSFAIGPISVANVANSLAIGAGAASDGIASLAVGRYAITAYGSVDAIAIGGNASANAASSIAIGGNSNATNKTQANGASSIALGIMALANSTNAIAIGTGAYVAYTLPAAAIAIGNSATANGSNSVAVGTSATTAFVANASALGANTSVSGANSTAVGYNTAVTKTNEVILGDMTNSALSVGIGSENFSTTNREKLLVDAGATSSVTAILGRGTLNNYLQLNIQNLSNGTSASSDVVATADNGTELINYVDMGINSSTNTQNVMGAADDAYLYTTGNNFLIGTATAAKALVFMTGGTTQSTNERMRIDGTTGFMGIGTTAPATALHVVGTNPLTLVGIQSGAATDSILTINGSGTVRKRTITNLLGGGSALTTGSIPFIGAAGTLAQNNASLFWDSTDSRLGVGTNTPSSDLTLFQSAGVAGPSRGFRFTGNSIGGTNTGSGFSMSLGYNVTSNKQLWLGDADYLNNSAGTFIRYSSSTGSTCIDAVNGNNTSRRAIALAVAGDPASGVILGNDGNFASPASFVWANGNMSIGNGYRANAAPTNGLIVQGNVGIGTSTPATALHVSATTNPLTLNGVQIGTTSDSILTISSGTVRKLSFSTLTSGASWSLTGNTGTNSGANFLGTTDLKSLRFKTNSAEGMVLDSLGNVGIGASPAFTTGSFQEKLLVDAGTTNSFDAIVGRGSINNYLQLNIQNLSNGTSASSDVVATADNGTESVNYVDLGINSSTNTQNIMGAADDAYLYTTGNNLLIGTGTAAKALVFMTGGTTQSTNERMRIDGTTGFVGIGTTVPATALHVVGTNPLTLMGVQTGAVTDSILTITAGTVRKLAPSALAASTSWSLTGNAGTNYATNFLGTTDLKSLRLRTNSAQGMVLDSLGNVGIGTSPGFTAGTFQEKLLVDAGTTNSFNAIVGRGTINNYLQLNIQNLSNGTSASSDVVATADNGTESINYVDLGINSSTNTQNIMGAADDAYLYTTGNNFLIGTGTAAKALIFMTGGTTQSTNERMRIDGTGNVAVGKTSAAYKVDVHGKGNFDSTLNAPAYTSDFQTLTFGSTTTWDQTKGATAAVTLTANATLSITNAAAGMYGLIRVTQDATGSRTLTLPAGSKVINGGGGVVALTTTAGATDVLSYFYDGTNYYWTIGYNYN